jgi:hypothetical protein
MVLTTLKITSFVDIVSGFGRSSKQRVKRNLNQPKAAQLRSASAGLKKYKHEMEFNLPNGIFNSHFLKYICWVFLITKMHTA